MDTSFDTLVREAWREAKINASAHNSATEPMLGAAYPPRAWVDQELGFGFGEGPSLQVTLLHLEAHNRRARKTLKRAGEPMAPRSPGGARKRESHRDREARLSRIERRAQAA